MAVIDGLVWLAADYQQDLRVKSNLIAALAIAEELFEVFREKGVKYLYCTAESQSAFNFNEMLGFKTTNTVFGDKYEVMEKEL